MHAYPSSLILVQVEGQTIRANEQLHKKREKVKSKYTQTFRRERQLSPGFLEDGPEEVCSYLGPSIQYLLEDSSYLFIFYVHII